MNILITGANGFIGQNLIKDLLSSTDNKIIGVSRSSSLFKYQKYAHIKADITDPKWLLKIPSPINCVIHLAQSKEYRSFPEKAREIFETNVLATINLLDWCKKNNISRFIFTSSGNVYRQSNSKLKESDDCEPDTFYGTTKLCSELIIKQYKHYFDLKILRLFGVYGKGQKNMLIPNIIDSVRENKVITLTSGKGLYITPLFIDDCVSMIKEIINKKSGSIVYNISGNETVSLEQIINVISKIMKKKPNVSKIRGEVKYYIGSNQSFINDYNYHCHIMSFYEGMKEVC